MPGRLSNLASSQLWTTANAVFLQIWSRAGVARNHDGTVGSIRTVAKRIRPPCLVRYAEGSYLDSVILIHHARLQIVRAHRLRRLFAPGLWFEHQYRDAKRQARAASSLPYLRARRYRAACGPLPRASGSNGEGQWCDRSANACRRRRLLLHDQSDEGMDTACRCQAARFWSVRPLQTRKARPQITKRRRAEYAETSAIEARSFAVLYAQLILAWVLRFSSSQRSLFAHRQSSVPANIAFFYRRIPCDESRYQGKGADT